MPIHKKQFQAELSAAAKYIRSQLPPPLATPQFTIDWRYVPADEIGGDIFTYGYIDGENFMIALIDVAGHGVTAALHSIAICNTLRTMHADPMLLAPSALLNFLNTQYPMEQFENTFTSMWYGVYNTVTRQLTYATAGDVLAMTHGCILTCGTLPLGVDVTAQFPEQQQLLSPRVPLLIFTDGAWQSQEVSDDICLLRLVPR